MATTNRNRVTEWKPLPLSLVPADLKRSHFDPMHKANMTAVEHKRAFDAALTEALRKVGAITADQQIVTARPKFGVAADGSGYTYGIAPVPASKQAASENATDDTFAALASRPGKGGRK